MNTKYDYLGKPKSYNFDSTTTGPYNHDYSSNYMTNPSTHAH